MLKICIHIVKSQNKSFFIKNLEGFVNICLKFYFKRAAITGFS